MGERHFTVRGAKRRELSTAGIKTHEIVLASARTVGGNADSHFHAHLWLNVIL